MFDINAFILYLIMMANAYAAEGKQYDYTKGLNADSFNEPAYIAPSAPERRRIVNQRGL